MRDIFWQAAKVIKSTVDQIARVFRNVRSSNGILPAAFAFALILLIVLLAAAIIRRPDPRTAGERTLARQIDETKVALPKRFELPPQDSRQAVDRVRPSGGLLLGSRPSRKPVLNTPDPDKSLAQL